MVTKKEPLETAVFRAISDPTRRDILDHLRAGELAAGELAQRFSVSRPAIAKHVRVLRNAGLLRERRQAQSRYYRVNADALAAVDRWLAPYRVYWAARLSDLKSVVENEGQNGGGDD